MKKQLFLMSALALTAFATTGCNKNRGAVYTPGTPLKVGLICLHDKGSTYDENFINAFEAAMDDAKAKNYVSDFEIKTDVPEEGRDCYNAAEEFVNNGFNIIFSDSFGHDVSMHEAASEFTNVQFSSATGIEARKSGLSNFHNAFASIYEGRFLAGMAAGYNYLENHESDTDKTVNLGYVGAYPYAEVISGYTSWYLGVKEALGTEYTVKMNVTYTKSWYSPEGEATAAQKLIDAVKEEGFDIMSQHADSYGAPSVCAQSKPKIPNVSYNIDTTKGGKAEDYVGSYVAHSRINWTPYYSQFIESMYKGEPIKGEIENNWTGSLNTKSVDYNVDYTNMVKETEHKTAIETAQKKLELGELRVFDTTKFTVNDLESKSSYYEYPPKKGTDYTIDANGHLTSMKGATDMYNRDTELVKTEGDKSWIQESVFRSAPSFDFIIDGINII